MKGAAVQAELAKQKNLLHGLLAQYGHPAVTPTGDDDNGDAEDGGEGDDDKSQRDSQSRDGDDEEAIVNGTISYREVLRMFRDFKVFDDNFTTPLAIRCFAGLTDRPEAYAGQELQFLDCNLAYDEFIEGLVRYVDPVTSGVHLWQLFF